jgi:hypothetical protein
MNEEKQPTPKLGFSLGVGGGSKTQKISGLGLEKKEDNREYVTALEGNKIKRLVYPYVGILEISQSVFSVNEEKPVGPLVIPLPDSTSTKVHVKYLPLLKRKAEDQGEISTPQTDSMPPLETPIREKTLEEIAAEQLINEAKNPNYFQATSDMDLPLLIRYRNTDLDEVSDEQKKFKIDVESRPDEATQEDYDRTPVEYFGKGLLRGMGWEPGKPIGLTNAKFVEPIEFVARPGHRSGLGAKFEEILPPTRKKLKPGMFEFEKRYILDSRF